MQVPVPLQVDAAVAIPLLHVPALQIEPAAYLRHAPLPSHLPSVPQPAWPRSTHLLLGSASPARVARHLPSWPACLHEKQLALQSLSQQKPSAQKPEAHSVASEQIWPIGFLPHDPFTQLLGATQSALLPQELPQVAPLHLNGEQEVAVGVLHAPAAQVLAWVALLVVALQLAALHTVPAGYDWQPLLPLHRPLVSQAAVPLFVQKPRGSAAPAGTLVHRPRELLRPHDTQVPTQALLQQTWSTQNPDWQSTAVAQIWPLGRLPQLPAVQTLGDTQSSLTLQATRHAVPAH
jgi:hypothetical protein